MRLTRISSELRGISIVVAISCLLLLACGSAQAVPLYTIVSDTFNTGSGSVIGRTPDAVNLPGDTYASSDNPFGAPPNVTVGTGTGGTGGAVMTVNSAGLVSIQSAGSYVKPAQFMISGDVKVGNIAGNNLGVGLGFNNINSNAFNDGDLPNKLQRITLGINGDLNFNQTLIASYSAANFGGNAFDPNSFYHLSYAVDTTTGGVSNITLSNGLGSQSYTLSTTAFTYAKTAYAAIYSNSGAVSTTGVIDNFMVEALPEPGGVVALLGLGALVVRRRRGH